MVLHIQIYKISDGTLPQWGHPGFREKRYLSEQNRLMLIPRNIEPVTLSECSSHSLIITSEYFHKIMA